ncbi:hypothetical protein NQ317_012598 [Molorchus minor]|uniref:Uncharacterized protein n=1 Tax=Molorchus minor TaxID=1323400 RepID=A0ABQ9J996_9CUCU|nr:hypothetical protein NQ317_012598 [Molorchus minor]
MLECNKDVPTSSTKFSYMLSMSLTQFSPSDCSNENQDLSHSFDINDLNFDTTQEHTLQNPKFDDNLHNEHKRSNNISINSHKKHGGWNEKMAETGQEEGKQNIRIEGALLLIQYKRQ